MKEAECETGCWTSSKMNDDTDKIANDLSDSTVGPMCVRFIGFYTS